VAVSFTGKFKFFKIISRIRAESGESNFTAFVVVTAWF